MELSGKYWIYSSLDSASYREQGQPLSLGKAPHFAYDFSKVHTLNPSSAHNRRRIKKDTNPKIPDPFLMPGLISPTHQLSDSFGQSLLKYPCSSASVGCSTCPERLAGQLQCQLCQLGPMTHPWPSLKVSGFCELWDFLSEHSSSQTKMRFL